MSQPLTDAQLRLFLDQLGLPQVDPAQYRASILPEMLKANIDLGRIRPVLVNTSCNSVAYTTADATGLFLNLVSPAPNQIIHAVQMSIRFTNPNTETINVQKLCGSTVRELWTDFAGDAGTTFLPEPYIGDSRDASVAWGSLGLHDIAVFGANANAANLQERLQINLVSPAALVKTAVITFDACIYELEDWRP